MENMRGKLYVVPVCDYLNDCCLLLYIITAVTVFCLCIYKLLSLLWRYRTGQHNIGCLYIILCDRYNVCSADFVRFFDDMTLK